MTRIIAINCSRTKFEAINVNLLVFRLEGEYLYPTGFFVHELNFLFSNIDFCSRTLTSVFEHWNLRIAFLLINSNYQLLLSRKVILRIGKWRKVPNPNYRQLSYHWTPGHTLTPPALTQSPDYPGWAPNPDLKIE